MSVRVFVSSPSDVPAERQAVERVAARVAGRYDHLEIEVYRWEANHYYSAHTGFQEQIEEIGGFDLVVGILWSRLGSPLPKYFGKTMPAPRDGEPYPSGTAFEILEAIEIRRRRGTPQPDILVYRKTAPTPSAAADDDIEQERLFAERKAVNAFFEDFFASEETGFRAAFQGVADLETFEAQFEADLEAWLCDNRSLERPRKWRVEERGTPFRGLNPFDAGHREVFFGRWAEIERAQDRLTTGSGFLLLDGASGTGKSSLVRAGLLPRLQDLDPDLRVAITRPETAEPMDALCQALFAEDALSELSESDFPEPAALAQHFLSGGDVAPVRRALERAQAAIEDPDQARCLVVLVDQCEALFTDQVPSEEQAAYGAVLEGLIASGQVQVVATLRGNAREAALAVPPFERLINAAPGLSLGLPAPDAFGEIVRGPAEAAGLAFERNEDGVGLDEVLLEEVARDPDALPLLQFALEQLYARAAQRVTEASARLGDVPDGAPILTLIHADYQAFGGLSGAIGAQAEAALAKVSLPARKRLAPLVRELTVAGSSEAVLGRAPTEVAAPDADSRALVEALINARVLLRHAPTPKDGAPKIDELRFTHERVLKAWDRARDAVKAAAQYLRVRGDLVLAEARWRDSGTPRDLLLPAGLRLAEAEDVLRDFGAELDRRYPQLRRYIQISGRLARRRHRLSQAAAAIFAVVAFAACWFGYQSRQNAQLATINQATAEANAESAEENARQAQENAERAETNARIAEVNAVRTEAALEDVALESELKSQALAQVAEERNRAERNFEASKTAIDALIFDVVGGLDDVEGITLETLNKTLDQVQIAMDELLTSAPENTDLIRSKTVMLSKFSQIYEKTGARDEALRLEREAVTLLRALLEQKPNKFLWRQDLSISLIQAGDLHLKSGARDAAKRAFVEALNIRRDLVARLPRYDDWQSSLATALARLGSFEESQGNWAAALSYYDESLSIRRRLVEKNPDNAEWQSDLSFGLGNLSQAQELEGKAESALKLRQEQLTIIQELLDADPTNASLKSRSALVSIRFGSLLETVGDAEAALASVTRGVTERSRLVSHDPSNLDRKHSYASGLNILGDLQRNNGDVSGAEASLERADEILREITARDPSNLFWKHDYANNLDTLALLHAATNRRFSAARLSKQSIALQREVVAADPLDTLARFALALKLQNLGLIEKGRGARVEALTAFLEAVDLFGTLTREVPTNTKWQDWLSSTLMEVGGQRNLIGDVDAAHAAFTHGRDIARALVRTDPQNVFWRSRLAAGVQNVALIEYNRGNLQAALTMYQEGNAILRKLLEDGLDQTGFRIQYVRGLQRTARVYWSLDETESGLAVLDEALEVVRVNLAREPDNTNWHTSLATTLDLVGALNLTIGDFDPAQTALIEAHGIFKEVADADHDNLELRHSLANSFGRLGALFFGLEEWNLAYGYREQARALLESLVEANPNSLGWKRDLALAIEGLGWIAEKRGDMAEVMELNSKIVPMWRELVAADPSRRAWQESLTHKLVARGDLLKGTDQPEGAAAHYKEAVGHLRQLVAVDTAHVWHRRNLATALVDLAGLSPRDGQAPLLKEASALLMQLEAEGHLPEALVGWAAALDEEAERLESEDAFDWQLQQVFDLHDETFAAFDAADYAAAFAKSVDMLAAVATLPGTREIDPKLHAQILSDHAFYALFVSQDAVAQDSARAALVLDPENLFAASNNALAEMFFGNIDVAKALFSVNQGASLTPEMTWEDAVRQDFVLLRGIGRDVPAMREIEEMLGLLDSP